MIPLHCLILIRPDEAQLRESYPMKFFYIYSRKFVDLLLYICRIIVAKMREIRAYNFNAANLAKVCWVIVADLSNYCHKNVQNLTQTFCSFLLSQIKQKLVELML